MNVDLKIITRLLAKRISKVIGTLINDSQKCIPGRQIFNNIQLLQDLIDYINAKGDTGAALLFLDQEKAFDRMSHTFILKTLQHFGFREEIIDWINIIYKDCNARVKINGHLTPAFSIQRGVRQGCPLSSLLYVLCIEVLCLEIKTNTNIKGLEYMSKQHKDLSYADDLSILTTSIESIDPIFNILDKFQKATNAKINIEKTEALWIGTWKENTITPMGLKWTNTMVKGLGVFVGNNRKEAENQSYAESTEKIRNKVKYWKGKGISLKGRVRVCNIFILSKLWYILKVKDIPKDILSEVNHMIADFIWEGKYHQRSLIGLEMNYEKGGLRLLSIEKRL